MGPPSLPCPGLPLLPSGPVFSAWPSRESSAEPEANLSPAAPPSDKMISPGVVSTLGP